MDIKKKRSMIFKLIRNTIVINFAMFLIIMSVALFNMYTVRQDRMEAQKENETSLRNHFDLTVKEQVETVISMLNTYYSRVVSGELTLDEAKFSAANVLRELKYGTNGYFWADTSEGVNVVLLGRDTEGTNRYNEVDNLGTSYMKDIINNGLKSEGGYSDYYFAKTDNPDLALPKRAYSRYFEPFDWVIGTGNYVDDIDAVVAAGNKAINQSTTITTIVMVVVGVITVSISCIIIFFMMNGMTKSLNEITDKLINSSKMINNSITQLNEASENLATGSSKQAAAIEETSATMNETASMVAQNAESTRVASQIATSAANMSNESMEHITAAVRVAEDMKESSTRVGKIVKTIDDIAFQTNLLAINATVEAARAGGDAGRSFSVVAEEVRNLAKKSADAVSETTDIIEKNISLTDAVKESAEHMRDLIEKTSQSVADLSKIISEINVASEEQANGIKQINIAVSEMEKITQENAAVAQENAASSNAVKNEIANLDDAVSIAKTVTANDT
jgi:methyl-accepting chemotaxis protein